MKRHILITLALAAMAVGCLIVIVSLMMTRAHAHSWYAPSCCSGHDCEAIPRDALVEELADGWNVEFVSAHRGYVRLFFPRKLKRDSQDGGFHACIRPDLTPICIYVPVNT
jgi:hypothetical protein